MIATLTAYRPNFKPQLATLWHASWLSSNPVIFADDTVERLYSLIDEQLALGWRLTLAIEKDKLIGFLALKPDQNWLDQLFIAPECQGKGIGAQLLGYAKSQMPDGFKLRTGIQNFGARRFYKRYGLEEIEITKSPYRDAEVVVFQWKGAT